MEDETIHAKLDGLKALIKEQFKNNDQQHANLRAELGGKAGKWVEGVAKGMIGTILFSVLGALLALVIGGGATLVAYNIIKLIV